MAAAIPAALKSADVQRFATRAAQLEKFKPIATYWLEYYVLQQILSKQLHASSAEVGEYAVQLMDKVEEAKTRFASETAISDDIVAKAFMEQFAGETFKRAEDAQNSDQVTRQTADTFQAAATFYDSLTIWGELDQESKAKSKFAKFHALRIARALKEGKDPNETNPRVEVPSAPTEDDELEAELKKIASGAAPDGEPVVGGLTEISTSAAGNVAEPTASSTDVDVTTSDGSASIGGGYFPSIPSTETNPTMHMPPVPSLLTSQVDGDDHITSTEVNEMLAPQIDTDTRVPVPQSQQPQLKAIVDPAQYYGTVKPAPQPVHAAGIYKTDDDAVMEAQKHAKWAISALNFEDVPTAVKELRIALQALGGL